MVKKRRSGFTLIELLVVIAIIAILAAILFPVFISARHRARIGACQSHQKQMVGSLMMYVDDYEGRLPRIQFLSTGGGGQLLCYPYLKNINILLCPGTFVDPDGMPPGFPKVRNMGFAYNESCLCDSQLTKSSVRNTDLYETDRIRTLWTGRPLGGIVKVSRTPAFFCSESVHSFYYDNRIVYVGFGWQSEDARNPARMVNGHEGGTNYAFLDGHVKWSLPAGNGFYQAIDGIDYDGNGTAGDSQILR